MLARHHGRDQLTSYLGDGWRYGSPPEPIVEDRFDTHVDNKHTGRHVDPAAARQATSTCTPSVLGAPAHTHASAHDKPVGDSTHAGLGQAWQVLLAVRCRRQSKPLKLGQDTEATKRDKTIQDAHLPKGTILCTTEPSLHKQIILIQSHQRNE